MVSISNKKKQANKMDVKTGSITLLNPRNTPQHQGKISPQDKRMEKDISSKKQDSIVILMSDQIFQN